MSAPIYAWVYEAPFHSVFLITTTVLSFLSNGLLLFIIITTPSSSIGAYRYLLAAFAISDLITSLAHALFQPLAHMTSSGLYFFSRHVGLTIGGHSVDTLFCLVFIATYYQTFLILAYHFIYRFITVTSGLTRSITKYWTTSHWIVLAVVANILYVTGFMSACILGILPSDETRALAPPEIEQLYGIDFHNPSVGFGVISVRRPDPITGEMVYHSRMCISLVILLGLFGGTAAVIVYCIWQINAVIRSSDNNFTDKTTKMQKDLFHALLIQTAVPVLFSYLPLAMILVFPIVTGISLGAFGNVLFTVTSIFPSIDAFFVLFFIARFRAAVIRLFRLPFDMANGSSTDRPKTKLQSRQTFSTR